MVQEEKKRDQNESINIIHLQEEEEKYYVVWYRYGSSHVSNDIWEQWVRQGDRFSKLFLTFCDANPAIEQRNNRKSLDTEKKSHTTRQRYGPTCYA